MTGPTPRPLPTGWHETIAEYVLELRAAGRTAQTVRLRRAHLAILARWATPRGPFDLTNADLVEWTAGQRWTPATRRSVRSTLRGFYSWAVDVGHTTYDPAARLPATRTPAPAPHPTPAGVYAAALAAADDDERLMIRLAGEMGLRRGEVARVHTGDVIPGAAGFALRVHGKGGKVRGLPMPDDLAQEVLTRPAGYLFPGSEEGHISAMWVGTRVGRLLPQGWTMHSLRHMFATRAYGVRHDLLVVQRLLGHSSVATTQVYVAVPDDDLRLTVMTARAC